MHLIPEFGRTVVAFIVVLGVLVFVHELGHYLAARWRGVHVETFSIGFGRAIATWTDRVGTQWRLAWLPLGGYVKLHGQERPEDVPAEIARGLAERAHLPREIGPIARDRGGGRAGRQLPARHGSLRGAVRDRGQAGGHARRRRGHRGRRGGAGRDLRRATVSPPSTARPSAASRTSSASSRRAPARRWISWCSGTARRSTGR